MCIKTCIKVFGPVSPVQKGAESVLQLLLVIGGNRSARTPTDKNFSKTLALEEFLMPLIVQVVLEYLLTICPILEFRKRLHDYQSLLKILLDIGHLRQCCCLSISVAHFWHLYSLLCFWELIPGKGRIKTYS